MATMRYANIDFNVVYVDPSNSSSGDGSTPANALNALPTTAAAFADNTCYLIRRTAEALLEGETVYYTGHCTGDYAFAKLKELLGERLQRISGGMTFFV